MPAVAFCEPSACTCTSTAKIFFESCHVKILMFRLFSHITPAASGPRAIVKLKFCSVLFCSVLHDLLNAAVYMWNLKTFDAASDALLSCSVITFKPIKRHRSDEKSDRVLFLFFIVRTA